MASPNVLFSLVSGRCPKCRTGKAFKYPFYYFTKASEIKDHCDCCGTKFEPEPGFFWGAMYFSYALNVAFSVISGMVLFFIFHDPDLWVYVTVIIAGILLLMPVFVRFSRLLMMYLIAPYRKYNRAAHFKTK